MQTILALDLPSIADAVTKIVIALLSLIAVGLVVVGLGRAVAGRRRVQVVIEDIVVDEGIPTSIVSGLSPQLRQNVRQAISTQTLDASYAHLKTLDRDKKEGLLVTSKGTTINRVSIELRATAHDSLAALSAGVGAVAPKEAEGLLAMLSASLPAQRGYRVQAFPTVRETATTTTAGLTLEFAEFGRAPDAVSTFWSSASPTGNDYEKAAANHTALSALLEPISLWIAIRLVARYLAYGRQQFYLHPNRHRELLGLRLELAGQMSLYAIRKQEQFATEFAVQALEDLSEASRLLPQYFRPHFTQAAVHERVGWTYREVNEPEPARGAFLRAVQAYNRADELLDQLSGSAPVNSLEHARQRVAARRTKCRLLSGDSTQIAVARRELNRPIEPQADDVPALYNAACLFVVALEVGAADSEQISGLWERRAWQLLGRSLLIGGDEDGPWELVNTDIELRYLDQGRRGWFIDQLRAKRDRPTGLSDAEARELLEQVLGAG